MTIFSRFGAAVFCLAVLAGGRSLVCDITTVEDIPLNLSAHQYNSVLVACGVRGVPPVFVAKVHGDTESGSVIQLSTAQLRDVMWACGSMCPRDFYEEARYGVLSVTEGVRGACYLCPAGKPTIGIGFNLEVPGNQVLWQQLFGDDPNLGLDMIIAQASLPEVEKTHLSGAQLRTLFNASVEGRKQEIVRLYGDAWPVLQANEHLAIEDAYFNSPALAGKRQGGGDTNFLAAMRDYSISHDNVDLQRAVFEIRDHSNPFKRSDHPQHHIWRGIQNRRDREACLLDSSVCIDAWKKKRFN